MRCVSIAFLLLIVSSIAFAATPYVRAGAGFDASRDTILRDRDCSATSPPALFGCGAGVDGEPLAARGDFGRTPSIDLAAGLELTSRTRVELALTHRDALDLEAEANFLGVAGDQPVQANGRATSALASGFLDIGRFFVGAGAGVSRNELGAITYMFPAIAPDAVTITRGGTHTAFAWSAAAGTSIPLTDRIVLDLALRYADLGTVRTDAGAATIIRPTRTLRLDIAGTRADVKTAGVTVSVRWRL